MERTPPRYALRFLRWFCREECIEEVEGNLVEMFEQEYERSPAEARRNFRLRVLRHFQPAFLRAPSFRTTTISLDMVQHYIRIALRNFMKYRGTFAINVIGLSTGLAVAFMVYLWINDEWTRNRYNELDERLYQVLQNTREPDGSVTTGAGTPGILAEALSKEIPSIAQAVSVVPPSWFSTKSVLEFENRKLRVAQQFAGASYFDVFSIDLIRGDKRTALSNKYGLLVSEEIAYNLFGSPDAALGKMVQWRWERSRNTHEITGVFRLDPAATGRFDVMGNYELFLDAKDWLREWGNSDPRTFVVVNEGVPAAQLNAALEGFLKSKESTTASWLWAQRYSDTYLYGRYEDGQAAGGRIEYVRVFAVIALVILVIACINFMNLSTARASRRSKEVGVKHSVGAGRGTLAMQFLSESLLLSVFGGVVAFALVFVTLPWFNSLTGKSIALKPEISVILIALLAIVVTGIVAGSYPAFYLSRFQAADALKGQSRSSITEVFIRKGLVIFQYGISFFLIVAVVAIYQQINFMQSRNLGYDRDQIVLFDLEVEPTADPDYFSKGGPFEKGIESFLQEVRQVPGVITSANYWHDVTGTHGELAGVDWMPGEVDDNTSFSNLEVGYDFLPTLNMQLVYGRNYSRDFANEESRIIINESALQRMGLKDPIGHTIRLWGEDREIIGVVKDFNFESLYHEVTPCVIQLVARAPRIMVKLDGRDVAQTLGGIRSSYEKRFPGFSFEYRFLDDDYNALYAAEQRVSTLAQAFASIAIIISCLGLFGLTAFTVERRMKEISIRRVFGASRYSILQLMSKEFATLLAIGLAVGTPLVWMAVSSWLESYAYRTTLQWWYFAIAAGAIFLITVATVAVNTVKILQRGKVVTS